MQLQVFEQGDASICFVLGSNIHSACVYFFTFVFVQRNWACLKWKSTIDIFLFCFFLGCSCCGEASLTCLSQ